MKLKELVCSLEPSKELRKLGIRQDSFYYWVKKEGSKTYQLFDRGTAGSISFFEEMYSAYMFGELLEVLPDKITTIISKTYGKEIHYFLFITKTKKTKWFNQPDYYVAYKTMDDRFLHSEREETMADAAGKMVIYLIKEGIIEVKKDV